MRKILSVILSAFVLVTCFTGCGGANEAASSGENSSELISSEKEPYTMDGKIFIFLGSSVTYGSASGGRSFADLIGERNNCTAIKLAVSGTTLVDNSASSYVARLKNESANYPVCDHLIVQLSTNDATGNKPLGVMTDSMDINSFDTSTVIGAIEYIIAFAKNKWNCKVSFYTGTKYDSAAYKNMVDALLEIQKKWGIGVLDLYNDPEMNAVSPSDYNKYMSDPIHPTLKGYEEWWLPKFEEFILAEGNKE